MMRTVWQMKMTNTEILKQIDEKIHTLNTQRQYSDSIFQNVLISDIRINTVIPSLY